MHSEIKQLKQRFDIFYVHSSLWIPLITSHRMLGPKNEWRELFKESVVELSHSQTSNSFRNCDLDKILREAELYLNKEDFERFITYCAKRFDGLHEHALDLCRELKVYEYSKEHNYESEQVFFSNIDFFLNRFPIKNILPNDKFIYELIDTVEGFFEDSKALLSKGSNENGVDLVGGDNVADANTQFYFENRFDHVKSEDVYNHFEKGLVESKFLTQEELNNYLRAAFEVRETPIKLFTLKNTISKKKVTKVFYSYYKEIAGKPHGKQKSYVALLGDFFIGYNTDSLSSNFSKSDY